MYYNSTAETFTGTGDVLTCTGAATIGGIEMLPFGAQVPDGAIVAYFGRAGLIEFKGFGVYDDSAGTITRNDNWNRNGATVDQEPSSNITLSDVGIIMCAPVAESQSYKRMIYAGDTSSNYIKPIGTRADSVSNTAGIDSSHVNMAPCLIPAGRSIYEIRFNVATAAASSIARVGIISVTPDGQPNRLLAESADIDTSTTGYKSASITPVFFATDELVMAWISCDSSIDIFAVDRRFASQPSEGFPQSRASDQRLNLGARQSTAVAPVYPGVSPFSDTAYFFWPLIMLRFT